jgi:hypothetical protein
MSTARFVIYLTKYVGLALCLLQVAVGWRDLWDRSNLMNTVWLIGLIMVLLAIPTRRTKTAESQSVAAEFSSVAQEKPPLVALARRPFGWSWAQWFVVVACCALLIGSFAATPKNRNDQEFLYGVILFQALALAGIVRATGAMFLSSPTLGVFGRLAVILVLGAVLLLLTFCSEFIQRGWG